MSHPLSIRKRLAVLIRYLCYTFPIIYFLVASLTTQGQTIQSGNEPFTLIQQADQAFDQGLYTTAIYDYKKALNNITHCEKYTHTLSQIISCISNLEMHGDIVDTIEAYMLPRPDCFTNDSIFILNVHKKLYTSTEKDIHLNVIDSLIKTTQDSLLKIEKLRSMAMLYVNLEKDYLARPYIEKAIKIHESSFDTDTILGELYFDMGSALRNLGYPVRAQGYLKNAENIYRTSNLRDTNAIARLLNNYGNTCFDLEEYDDAKKEYLKAIQLTKNIKKRNAKNFLLFNLNLGSCYLYSNKLDSAKLLFEYCSELIKNYAVVPYEYYEQYGDFLQRTGKLHAARNTFLKILEKSYYYSDYPIYTIQHHIAKTYLTDDNLDQSLIYANNAILTADHTIDLNNPETINWNTTQSHYILEILRTRINILRRQYSHSLDRQLLDKIYQNYRALFQGLETIRTGPYADQTKLLLAKHLKAYMTDALAFCRSAQNILPDKELHDFAFQAMEKSRNAELFEKTYQIQAATDQLLPDSLWEKEVLLKSEIMDIRYKLNQIKDEDSISITLQNKLLLLQRSYAQYKLEINEKFPSFYQGMYSSELKVSQIQNDINPTEQILEYFWADSFVAILSITKSQTKLHFIDITENLKNKIQWTINQCTLPPYKSSYEEYASSAFLLYEQLVSPVLDHTTESLTISAEDILSYLPFEALITEAKTANFRTAPYLINDLEISYAYNIILKDQQKEQTEITPKLLALAFSSSSQPHNIPSRRYQELPRTAHEIRSVSRLFPKRNTKLLIDQKANKNAFLSHLKDYNMIHLAVHGIADTTNTLSSRLLFKHLFIDDSLDYLNAYEIYGLRMDQIELAVLSACQSGIGKEVTGEGIFSVARAFTYAGAKRTLMSLWSVDDISTAEIMSNFYSEIVHASNVSAALRKGKVDYIANTMDRNEAHPYYWASMIFTGSAHPILIAPDYRSKFVFFTCIAAIFLATLILVWIRKSANRSESL